MQLESHTLAPGKIYKPSLWAKKRRWVGVVIAVWAVWACSLSVSSSYAAELTIANAGEPQTLDPHRYNLRLEETLLNDLFMGLTTFNAAGEIVPGSAARWTVSEDGLTWTFYLHADLTWSDGQPLTAEDFVYSFRRLVDPATAASLAYFMNMVKNAPEINAGEIAVEMLGVQAIDKHTLRIDLQQPYPFLLERLLYPTAFPVPRHVIEQVGDDWVKPEHWVSNGAYTLADWRPQAHIDLVANQNFRQSPSIKTIRYVPLSNELSAFNRFRNGELHVIPSFPVGNLAELQQNKSPALRLAPLLSMFYLVFNTEQPPFDQVGVRQALSLAIQQDILTEKVLKNGATAATSFAPGLISAYQGAHLPHLDQAMPARIKTAQALLRDAGYSSDNPLKVTLRHLNVLENKKINLAISGMWRRIGVQTTLQQSDLRSHFADLRQADFQVAWAGWVGENNAEHYLGLLQSSIGDVNYGRFAHPTFDALMAQAQMQADLSARNQLLSSAEAVAVHFYPVVPLYTNAVRRLVDPKLEGWVENPRDMHQSRYLSWR